MINEWIYVDPVSQIEASGLLIRARNRLRTVDPQDVHLSMTRVEENRFGYDDDFKEIYMGEGEPDYLGGAFLFNRYVDRVVKGARGQGTLEHEGDKGLFE
jgi:hypothetical protein